MVLGHLSYKIHYYSLHTGDMVFHISFVTNFCLHWKPWLYCLSPTRRYPKPLTTSETEVRCGFKSFI